MKKKILLLNTNYYDDIFTASKVRAAISNATPPLGLITIAGPLLEAGCNVEILNLNIVKDYIKKLIERLKEFQPDFVGITATTPTIKKAYELSDIIKSINNHIIVVAGGPHPSALPMEVLQESSFDCVVRGEGDIIFRRLIVEGISQAIPNLFFKKDNNIVESFDQNFFVENLDSIPFPPYHLIDIKQYRQPEISCRRNPVAYMETSRGCFARCIYCNKNIFGYKIRMKSVERVLGEMEFLLKLGFKEIHIIDDIFTADMKRAYQICEEIIKKNMQFSWYPRGGIRVDRVDKELLAVMKRAGCYRIPFGIESGSQKVLDSINKKITLEQAENAVKCAKDAQMEVECYFMLGLPEENEEDIMKSIEFAIKLDPDYCKFALTIPLPGTPLFEDMLKNNQIKNKDWEKYSFSTSSKDLFIHKNLSYEILEKYNRISYKKFYWRWSYILKMLIKTLRQKTFISHIRAFINTNW